MANNRIAVLVALEGSDDGLKRALILRIHNIA